MAARFIFHFLIVYIDKLDKGYEEIENLVFGEAKERKIEEIVKGVSTMRDLIINVSKYLEIGVKHLVGLFKKVSLLAKR